MYLSKNIIPIIKIYIIILLIDLNIIYLKIIVNKLNFIKKDNIIFIFIKLIWLFIKINNIYKLFYFKLYFLMGIGDWGLGIGDWGLGPIPNPQSPITNPQSPSNYYI